MTKKAGGKKRVIITVTALVVLLALSVLFAVLYHNYTKEICVMEPVEHMGQREGVSMDNILVVIKYSIITNETNGGGREEIDNYLFVFENGDVYSGYGMNYFNGYSYNIEAVESWEYYCYMDDRFWDYLYGQCYWGRLSPCDLDGVINELAQVDDFDCYYREENVVPEPQMEIQTEQAFDQGNNDIYRKHEYRAKMESDETEFLRWVSEGYGEEMVMYLYNEHAHNAIDIVKSTWAYGQWTNQIFGEGWEERIDLKDEMEVIERERSAIQQLMLYWKFVWESILSLFSH